MQERHPSFGNLTADEIELLRNARPSSQNNMARDSVLKEAKQRAGGG